MTTKRLEKRAEEQETGNSKIVIVTCGYSGKELRIPVEIYKKVKTRNSSFLDRDYEGFYVSPSGSFYLDKHSFNMFTED